MPANLQIRRSADELMFRVTEKRGVPEILRSVLWECLVAGVFLWRFHSQMSAYVYWLIAGIAAFSIARELVLSLKGTDVTLTVMNFEFVSSGRAPGGYEPSTILRAEIYCIEFRDATRGGEETNSPMGLHIGYHGWPSKAVKCVLPDIDEAQTSMVIEGILSRFPDTGRLPVTGSAEPYLISLNLNKPSQEPGELSS